MGIEDIQISEELETNAPSIKYSGNEGPKSPQQMQEMMVSQLEEEYSRYLDDMMEQGLDPMSFEEFLQQALAESEMAGGNPLPNDPTKPVNPFAPKPTGPTLPDRQMAAYGGIMGMDGRKQYGIGSFFQKAKDKFVDDIIPNEIKENPLLTAALVATGANYVDLIPGDMDSKGYVSKIIDKIPQGVKDVGTKTTILARRSCDDVKLWPEQMFEKIYCFVTFCRWTSGMVQVANQLQGHYSNAEIVTPDLCAKYGKEIGLDQPNNEWASVGALTISHMLKLYDKIHICGFDHLKKNDKGHSSHYFHKPPKDDRFHSGLKEKAFTEQLILAGKVIRVDSHGV